MRMLPVDIGTMIESIRPTPLRRFDQIPMRTDDLLRQTLSVAERLDQKEIVFIGDFDCASVALVGQCRSLDVMPKLVHIVDFDMRVLRAIRDGFNLLGMEQILQTTVYNVFNPIASSLEASFDWFYANPPYGQFNHGESVWLFVHRGIEFCKLNGGGTLIIPNDRQREWTDANAFRIKCKVEAIGGRILQATSSNHSYHLDDDPDLKSVAFTLEGV